MSDIARCCPDDVAANCRNHPVQCWACVWADDALAPTQYLPLDRHARVAALEARKQARRQARQAAKRSAAAQRARANRLRGKRFEQRVAKETGGRRVPLSGALGGAYSNDVEQTDLFPPDWRLESKERANLALYRWLEQGDRKPDVLAIGSPHKPILYVMDRAHVEALKQWAGGGASLDVAKLREALRLLEEALTE